MKTLYQLFHEVKWDDVKEVLIKHYPDYESSIKGFELAFHEILEMKPKENKYGYYVVVDKVVEEAGEWYDVYGKKPNDVQTWALSFYAWDEWLGMYVDKDSLLSMTKEEYIAHVLWEMTYYGFDSQTVNERIGYRVETIAKALSKVGEVQ